MRTARRTQNRYGREVFLAQINAPEWAPIAVALASIAVVATSLLVLIVYWRNNR